jgi:hypothetical protein
MATAAVDGNSGKTLSHVQGKDGEGRRRGEEEETRVRLELSWAF